MSYLQDSHNELIDSEGKRVSQQLSICQAVQETIETDGWRCTISPLIDKMIIDIVGGKIGDSWVSGKLDRAKKEERREFYIGYKQALIDLHSRVMFHVEQIEVLRSKVDSLLKEKEERYRVPMFDDTRYKTEV